MIVSLASSWVGSTKSILLQTALKTSKSKSGHTRDLRGEHGMVWLLGKLWCWAQPLLAMFRMNKSASLGERMR